MKKPLLFLISCTLFLVLFVMPVTALFGRVADFNSYHHVCFKQNDATYNFILSHTQADAWPCGNININDSSIRIECVSSNDGAYLGKFTNCNGGKSCGLYGFYSDKALGIHKNSDEPSWEPIGNLVRSLTQSVYTYDEYKTSSWFLSTV